MLRGPCYLLYRVLREESSHESAVGSSYHETWDEESTRNTSTIRPTRNKEIHNEQDNQSRQCEGT